MLGVEGLGLRNASPHGLGFRIPTLICFAHLPVARDVVNFDGGFLLAARIVRGWHFAFPTRFVGRSLYFGGHCYPTPFSLLIGSWSSFSQSTLGSVHGLLD